MKTNFSFNEDEESTIKAYNKNAEEWSASHATEGFWEQEHILFSELLPQGNILEVGTGSGRDAIELTKRYEYTGIDIS